MTEALSIAPHESDDVLVSSFGLRVARAMMMYKFPDITGAADYRFPQAHRAFGFAAKFALI